MSITKRLEEHIRNGGTANDAIVGDLFREWHHLPDDWETDLTDVERWAFDLYDSPLPQPRPYPAGCTAPSFEDLQS